MTGGKILPTGASDYLRKRGREGFGMVLIAGALWALVAVLGYSAGDPSLNSAGTTVPSNILGWSGAIAADLLLQSLGFACFVPILTLFIWGGRLFRGKALHHIGTRILALAGAAVLYAISLSALPISENWPLMTRMGGFTGSLLMDSLQQWPQLVKFDMSVVAIASLSGFIGAVLWITAMGLSRQDWQRTAVGMIRGVLVLRDGAVWLKVRVQELAEKREKGLPVLGRSKAETGAGSDNGSEPEEDLNIRVAVGDGVAETPARPADPQAKTAAERAALVADKREISKESRKAKASRQRQLDLGDGVYQLPPLDLLESADSRVAVEQLNKDALQQNAKFLASVLADFGVKGEIVKVRPGPVVTLYELEPAPGTKTARVIGLSGDIARSMSAVSVRIAVVPGQNVIGIELPNLNREMVYMREMVGSRDFEKSGCNLPLALGKDIGGTPVTVDLARMPHLLIAGTTGSGKSVAMNTMILSLLYKLTPNQCKFIMIDPKMLELSVYEGILHLLTPVVTDPSKAVVALKWAVREMEDRYRIMSQIGVRNITGYNIR
ncbi:MAG: DNA translocase FtsK 4TM domain-containing protein, partial [Rhodospirillales bacterium]|nr:DNA translocase FtsK 4TM domain-containing protein [Rhodospirillales bacterium]